MYIYNVISIKCLCPLNDTYLKCKYVIRIVGSNLWFPILGYQLQCVLVMLLEAVCDVYSCTF